MNIEQIPIVAVSYNSPDLIEALLRTVRQFYSNKVYIVDGSAPERAALVGAECAKFDNVEFIPFGYNIHHGPGMAWAIHHLDLAGPVLFLDSDVEVLHGGMIEALAELLTPELYGVGDITYPQLADSPQGYSSIAYLSPACMMCNIEVMRQWPVPIKHGAPMILPMLALAKAGRLDLIRQADWVKNDYAKGTAKVFIKHEWQGTVIRTNGYHYDTREQTLDHNTHLLPFMPADAHNVLEIGCGDGGLARAYKNVNAVCNYSGVEADAAAVALARKPCDFVFHMDIETADQAFFEAARNVDCWVLDEVLERLGDPWALLAKIRQVIPANGTLVACIPNMQHWSVQARINRGDLSYASAGLPERGQLRWFSRVSMLEMFQKAGFQVVGGLARMGPDAGEKYLPAIRLMAECAGIDPETALQDAAPLHYVVKAVPA